jgi:hypothetical protein
VDPSRTACDDRLRRYRRRIALLADAHGSEVDFIWTRGKRAVGVEVKASAQWRREFGGPLKSLIDNRIVHAECWR